jgi:DNA-binding SARP family transcriptional activator/TolB-like protein
MLELQAFGPLDVNGVGGDPPTILTQPKRLALLSYLVLARPRGYQRRDTLLAVFWPEVDQVRGRKALSQSLFVLRRALPSDMLFTRGTEEVAVDTARLRCDVLAFEEALNEARWADALAHYRGDLLAGFHIADASGFEHWLERERERLRELAAGAAWSLAAERIRTGDLVDAERAAQRALGLVPTDESPVRAFVHALAEAGDRAAALRFYDKFTCMLAEELEIEPAPETVAVAEAVRSGTVHAELGRDRGEPVTADRSRRPVTVGDRSHTPAKRPPPAMTSGTVHVAAGPRRRWLWAAAAVLAAVAIAWPLLLGPGDLDTVAARLAVLPFENHTGEASMDALGLLAADWITAGLTAIDTVQVVPSSTVVQDLAGAANTEARPRRIARLTGAGLVVTGSILRVGDSLEFRAHLVDPAKERVLDSFDPARAPRSEPTAALGPLRQRITGRVALRLDGRFVGLLSVTDPAPPTYEAYEAYITGVELFFGGRYRDAIRELDRARQADSSFFAPWIWTASAYGNMNEPARKDSVLHQLLPHRAELSPMDRAGMDIMAAQLRGDIAAVYRISRDAIRRRPSTEGRLIAGSYALMTNRPGEAVQILQAEPETGATRARWLSYHSVRTRALHVLAQHRRELEAAREARRRFPDRVEPVLWEARALVGLGRTEEARRTLEEGMTLPSPQGSPGFLQVEGGLALRRHGHAEAGEKMIRRGLAWYEADQSRHDRRFARARANLWLGSCDAAVELLQELAGEEPTKLDNTGYLGLALASAGRSGEAREIDARLAAWTEPYVRGQHLYWRAVVAAHLGEPERAITFLREAIAQGVSYSSLHENEALRPLWDDPTFQALIQPRG